MFSQKDRLSWLPGPLLIVLPIIMFLFFTNELFSQAEKNLMNSYNLRNTSEMWLEGSASVTDYECEIEDMNASIQVGNFSGHNRDSLREHDLQAGLKLRVDQIDCGKKKMNSDMREALKSDKHRFIRFELEDAKRAESVQMASVSSNNSKDWFNIEVIGYMTIAGERREVSVDCEGQPIDSHQFRVRGNKRINMENFDVSPPTAMFGLIKVEKWLTVHFDFTVGPESEPS